MSVQAPNPTRAGVEPARRRPSLGAVGELLREHAASFVVLAGVAFAPLIIVVVYAGAHGKVLIGTNGGDYFDQFQYLAWIRDEGSHVLASNLWVIGHTPHDYVQPMYLVSGILWRLGLSIQLTYLLWKPIAVLVLFVGFAAYVRHLVAGGRWARAAALALALFYASPASPLESWTHFLSAARFFQLIPSVDDASPVATLWGFEHTAIAIGLMPVFLIACERVLGAVPAGPSARPKWNAVGGRWGATAAASGLLVSWLHPWQGIILLGIVAGLIVVHPPRRRFVALALPVAATVLPLLYGFVLSHTDQSWRVFNWELTMMGVPPLWALGMSLGPLVLFALLGLRRPRSDREWMLVLWPPACAVVLLALPQFPPHALAGLTLPLAILAVAGWQRAGRLLRVPRSLAGLLGTVVVAAFTVPYLVDHMNLDAKVGDNTVPGAIYRATLFLSRDQAAALKYLDRDPRAGGVLAPWLLSFAVPAFSDREVFAGHQFWEPQANLVLDNQFFAPATPLGARRSILRRSRARFVIGDCPAAAVSQALAALAQPVARYGCETVYETG